MTEQPPSTPGPSPPPAPVEDRRGWVQMILDFVKTLTFSNVVMIIILIIVLIPTYFVYRVLNDEEMLYRFLSSYKEIPNPIPGSNCTLRQVSVRGGSDNYSISTGFAFQGADRWTVGVILGREPNTSELESYCNTLNLIVDYMRRPEEAPSPTYPNSDEPLIWHYQQPPASAP
jgi:hypothetical protein